MSVCSFDQLSFLVRNLVHLDSATTSEPKLPSGHGRPVVIKTKLIPASPLMLTCPIPSLNTSNHREAVGGANALAFRNSLKARLVPHNVRAFAGK